jgi:hypothetical protein
MNQHLPESERERREEEQSRDPQVTLAVGVITVVLTVGLMAVSAEWVSFGLLFSIFRLWGFPFCLSVSIDGWRNAEGRKEEGEDRYL